MPTHLENDISHLFNSAHLQDELPQHYRKILSEFKKTAQNFVFFNVFFSALLILECALFVSFLPLLAGSYILAFALGGIFLTFFSYLILLFYFQARKPEQFALIRDRLIVSCKQILGLPHGGPEHHLSIAAALLKLSTYLQDFEWRIYEAPKLFGKLASWISQSSAYCHWKDVFQMKELLLHAAIQQHLEQIRSAPTDLELHASLASTYVALSQIYLEPKRMGSVHPRLSTFQKKESFFQEKFRRSAELAIEEFRILSHYAPKDPWVHEQLAVGYRDLQLPAEEIREVEFLLELKPHDLSILFRLGILYFEQRQNAKGLQIYEKLKKARYREADDLISLYGKTFRESIQ